MSKICRAKHTDFQPKEWKCPNCGADNERNFFYYFYVEEVPMECELLHDDDYVVCDNCDGEWNGDELSEVMKTEDKTEKKKCPCCNGTGWIVESKEEENDIPEPFI